jgi:hypothetical protein
VAVPFAIRSRLRAIFGGFSSYTSFPVHFPATCTDTTVQSIPNSTSLMTLLVGYLVYKVRLALNARGSVITGRLNNSRTAKTFPSQVKNRVLSRCYGPQRVFQSHLQTVTSLFLNDGHSRQFFGVLKSKFTV